MIYSQATISVVIPVKNEASKIGACIESILYQSISVSEIIVIDSGSTDGTLEILKSYKQIRLIEIQPEDFNHGETRNLGVSLAKGEYVLMTVGDAKAGDKDWIKKMLEGFIDSSVAGVCGKQIVAHDRDKNPVEWNRTFSQPEIIGYSYSVEEFEKLSPFEKKNVCGWDDVNAMYKTSVLRKIPFRKTPYSEDAIWAKDAILAGYKIVYNMHSTVYHYHMENEEFTFRRTLTTLYFRYKYFGYIYPRPKRGFTSQLRILKTIWQSYPLTTAERIKWIKYNYVQFKAIKHAYSVFMKALSCGQDELDLVHIKYCGTPPIPSKNS